MASFFSAATGGGAGGAAATVAAKSGLFKPTALFKGAANAVAGQAQKGVKEKVAAVVGGQGGKIDWTTYNWPSKSELFSIIHFDLAELKEKRDAGVHAMVLWMYRWWLGTLALCGLNFVDCCILTGVASPFFSGVNVLFSIIWLLVWSALGMGMVYKAYHGFAEGSIKSKVIAKVLVCILLVLGLTHVIGNFGNVNGISGLSGARFHEARAEGASEGGVRFWEAVTVIESLLWLGDFLCISWAAFRIFKGPSSANAAEQLPK